MLEKNVPSSADPDRPSRATEAALAVAMRHGIESDRPRVLRDSNNTTVHLAPAPVVARVATNPLGSSLERELRVAGYLSDVGADAVSPSPELPARVYEEGGLKLTFWTFEAGLPDARPTGRELGRSFHGVLEALAGYEGELPSWRATIGEVGRLLGDQTALVLSSADRQLLRAEYERLTGLLDGLDLEEQPLHGDAHFGNVMAVKDGLRWLDFEAACRGPREWDLSAFGSDARANDALSNFPDVDAEGLKVLQELRELSVIVWCSVEPSRSAVLERTAKEKLAALRRRISSR